MFCVVFGCAVWLGGIGGGFTNGGGTGGGAIN
jgi:hypothetical protein